MLGAAQRAERSDVTADEQPTRGGTAPTRRRVTITAIARAAGVSVPTVSRAWSTAAPTSPRRPVSGSRNCCGCTSAGAGCPYHVGPHRPGLQRPRQPVGGRDHPRGGGRRPRRRHGHGRLRDPPAQHLGPAVAAEHAGARHRRRHPGDVGPGVAGRARAAPPGGGHRRRRPGRPAGAGRADHRRHQLVGRSVGHRAPAQPGPPAGRLHRRGPDGCCAAGPVDGYRADGRRSASSSTTSSSGTATSTTSPASTAATRCWTSPTRPPSSRPATRWPSACTRRSAGAGCGCRTT